MKILDRLDELDKTATPDPWKTENGSDGLYLKLDLIPQGEYGELLNHSDAHLICESRNALRALIEVARAAKHNQKTIGAMPWRINEERDIEFTEVTRSLFRAWMLGPMSDLDEALKKLEALDEDPR